jgi:hypothetical protein
MAPADGIIFNMDESAAASRELAAEVPVDANADLDQRACKCVRKQQMDGKEYIVSDLAALLKQRKWRACHANYWERLAVDIVTVEEKDEQNAIRHDQVVVRCLCCGDTHNSRS